MGFKDCIRKIAFDEEDRVELNRLLVEHGGDEMAAASAFIRQIDTDIESARAQLLDMGYPVALPGTQQAVLPGAQAARGTAQATAGQPASEAQPAPAQPPAQERGGPSLPPKAAHRFMVTDEASFQKIVSALENRLRQIGATNVPIRFERTLPAKGATEISARDGLAVILGITDDALHTIDHEGIHVLRQLGVISDEDWSILADAARKKWLREYNIAGNPDYADLSDQEKIEEAVAEAFADYAKGKRETKGAIARIFGAIKAFFRAVGLAKKDAGIQRAEQVFRRIDTGEAAKQARPQPKAKAEAQGKKLQSRAETPTEAVAETKVEKRAKEKISANFEKARRPYISRVVERFKTVHEEAVERAMNSDAFKKWFGDSVVVDEDGRPRVVFHGTSNSLFSSFGTSMSFFSGRVTTASSYVGEYTTFVKPVSLREAVENRIVEIFGTLDPDKIMRRVKDRESIFISFGGGDMELHDNGKIRMNVYPDDEFFFSSVEHLLSSLDDIIVAHAENVSGQDTSGFQGIYEAFIKLENPLVIDAQFQTWDAVPNYKKGDLFLVYSLTETGNKDMWSAHATLEEAEKDRKSRQSANKALVEAGEAMPRKYFVEEADPTERRHNFLIGQVQRELLGRLGRDLPFVDQTNTFAAIAEELGHDGIIFKNIFDYGAQSVLGTSSPDDVFVVFHTDNIKSIFAKDFNPFSDNIFLQSRAIAAEKSTLSAHGIHPLRQYDRGRVHGAVIARSLAAEAIPLAKTEDDYLRRVGRAAATTIATIYHADPNEIGPDGHSPAAIRGASDAIFAAYDGLMGPEAAKWAGSSDNARAIFDALVAAEYARSKNIGRALILATSDVLRLADGKGRPTALARDLASMAQTRDLNRAIESDDIPGISRSAKAAYMALRGGGDIMDSSAAVAGMDLHAIARTVDPVEMQYFRLQLAADRLGMQPMPDDPKARKPWAEKVISEGVAKALPEFPPEVALSIAASMARDDGTVLQKSAARVLADARGKAQEVTVDKAQKIIEEASAALREYGIPMTPADVQMSLHRIVENVMVPEHERTLHAEEARAVIARYSRDEIRDRPPVGTASSAVGRDYPYKVGGDTRRQYQSRTNEDVRKGGAGKSGRAEAATERGGQGDQRLSGKPSAVLKPVTEKELRAIKTATSDAELVDFLRRPGWAVVSGIKPAKYYEGVPNVEEQKQQDQEAFERYLKRLGIPYERVTGFYKGEPDGEAFLVLADENEAIRLGRWARQESVLTNKGLVYAIPEAPDTVWTGALAIGQEAEKQDFYSKLSGGLAFSMELDFENSGPGVPVLPQGYRWHEGRPQLPVNSRGKVELHHWSDQDFTIADPAHAGDGTIFRRGADARWRYIKDFPRGTYWGINPRLSAREPGTGYVVEWALRQHAKHHYITEVDPEKLYPIFEDPDGFKEQIKDIKDPDERVKKHYTLIRDAGYIGFYTTVKGLEQGIHGNAAYTFHKLPVRKADKLFFQSRWNAAWHGSPYLFNKFDISKLGTGEGAQAFGWGLYFADRKGVANWYKRSSPTAASFWAGKIIYEEVKKTHFVKNDALERMITERLSKDLPGQVRKIVIENVIPALTDTKLGVNRSVIEVITDYFIDDPNLNEFVRHDAEIADIIDDILKKVVLKAAIEMDTRLSELSITAQVADLQKQEKGGASENLTEDAISAVWNALHTYSDAEIPDILAKNVISKSRILLTLKKAAKKLKKEEDRGKTIGRKTLLRVMLPPHSKLMFYDGLMSEQSKEALEAFAKAVPGVYKLAEKPINRSGSKAIVDVGDVANFASRFMADEFHHAVKNAKVFVGRKKAIANGKEVWTEKDIIDLIKKAVQGAHKAALMANNMTNSRGIRAAANAYIFDLMMGLNEVLRNSPNAGSEIGLPAFNHAEEIDIINTAFRDIAKIAEIVVWNPEGRYFDTSRGLQFGIHEAPGEEELGPYAGLAAMLDQNKDRPIDISTKNPLEIPIVVSIYYELSDKGEIVGSDHFTYSDIIGKSHDNGRALARRLARNGVQGHRFYDGESRKRKHRNPTFNYVIYDDEAVKILRRYQSRFRAKPVPNQPFIPNRRIWDEIHNANGIWAKYKGAKAGLSDALDRARIAIQDRFLPVLRAQQAIEEATGQAIPEWMDPYLTETTYTGRVGRRLRVIHDEYVAPIVDLIAEGKEITVDSAGEYLYALHAKERNAFLKSIDKQGDDALSGMTDQEADDIIRKAHASPDADRYKKIAAFVHDLMEKTLDLRVDAGLISKQDADTWRKTYKHYVPLRGFEETDYYEAAADVRTGRRYSLAGPESKRALGRESRAFNPLQMAITQAQEVAIRAEKNRVAQALYYLVATHPSKNMWEIKDVEMRRFFNKSTGLIERRAVHPLMSPLAANEMAVKIGGKEKRIVVYDERLAVSLGALDAPNMSLALRLLAGFSRYFSSVTTMLDPSFVVRNAFRDVITASINIEAFGGKDAAAIRKAMLRDWWKGFYVSYKGMGTLQANTDDLKWYKEYEESGAKVWFWALQPPDQAISDLAKSVELKKGSRIRRVAKLLSSPEALVTIDQNPVLGQIERLNLAVDNAIRFAAYKEARKRGWSKQKAAALAKDLTVNFNRKGTATPVLNAAYPFFNAAVQGTEILLRAMTNKRVQGAVVGMVAFGVMMDLVNAMLSERDDDGELAYDKIPNYRLEMSVAVMNGDHAVTVPMPYGYNVFPYIGTQIGKVMRGVKKKGDAMADAAMATFSAFSPVFMDEQDTPSQTLVKMLSPTVTDPLIEIAQNKDWMGRPIVPRNPFGDYGPDAYKYYNSAPNVWIAVADRLNRLTGGNKGKSGLIDVSPEILDHLWKFAAGGAGRFGGRVATVASAVMSGEADTIKPHEIPFARQVFVKVDEYNDVQRYYQFRDAVKAARANVKAAEDAGEKADKRDYKLAGLYDLLKEADKGIRKIRNERKQFGPRASRRQRDAWRRREAEIVLPFNREYIRVMGPQAE